MLGWLLQPLRWISAALIAHDSPRQLAWGVVLGMMLGLLPKDNLTAFCFGVALFSLRVNLGMGLAAATAFSWIGTLLDAHAHQIGWRVLSFAPLQSTFAWAYDLPLAPWSGLNNTVVVGQLMFGLYAAYPMYWLSSRILFRWRESLAGRLRKYRMTRVLLGADLATRLNTGE